MKTKKLALFGFNAAALFAVLLLSVSCSNPAGNETSGNITPSGLPEVSLKAYINSTASDEPYINAIEGAFSNKQNAIGSDTQIVVLDRQYVHHMSDNQIASIKSVYDRDGVIVLVNPDEDGVNAVCDAVGHVGVFDHIIDGSKIVAEVYAFNNFAYSYILGNEGIDGDSDYTLLGKGLLDWINEHIASRALRALRSASRSAIAEVDIDAVIDAQTITMDFPVTVDPLTDYPQFKKTGVISTVTHVRPLYAFRDQASPGDYYVIDQQVTSPNGQWYTSMNANNEYGALYFNYMGKLAVKNELFNQDDTAVSDLSATMQSPENTVSSTSYTSGMTWTNSSTWSISGSASASTGAPGYGASVTGSYSQTSTVAKNESQTRSISDINIQNTGDGTAVAGWNIIFNNLNEDMTDTSHRYLEPPLASRSTQYLYSDWLWSVSSTADNSTDSFKMTTSLQGTEWHSKSGSFPTMCEVDIPTIAPQTITITPPSRVPTGALVIYNDASSGYLSNIQVWKDDNNSATPDYSYNQDSIPAGNNITMWLPAASSGTAYSKVTFRLNGENYTSARPFNLQRAASVNVYAGNTEDFTAQ